MMARRVFLGIIPLGVLAAALAVTWLPETFSTWEKLVRLALCAPLLLYFPGRMATHPTSKSAIPISMLAFANTARSDEISGNR